MERVWALKVARCYAEAIAAREAHFDCIAFAIFDPGVLPPRRAHATEETRRPTPVSLADSTTRRQCMCTHAASANAARPGYGPDNLGPFVEVFENTAV